MLVTGTPTSLKIECHHRDFVVAPAERKIPEHFKMRQVRPIADQTEIVGANTRLQRSLATTVRLVEEFFETLYSAANKERGIVVILGDDATIHNERKAKLLEAASN